MRPLRGELLWEAWERGVKQGHLDRPLTLLAVACPGRRWEELAGLSLAQREVELLQLRSITFGDTLRGCVPCSFCATRLEMEIQVSSILERAEALNAPDAASWRHDGCVFTMRRATTRDLSALASAPDPRRRLLELCTVCEPTGGSVVGDCEALAVEHFNRLNEGAETRLTLQCPACSATDQVDLDIGRFLWAEVRHAALTTLREVHELASAYGWSEAEILDLSSTRRAMYLGMIDA
jgi:hypothetical protein